ncbi:hypothetical protein HW511_11100 [Asaia siamensis]|uniref:Uncharacterized protein n=1 Tax=Asaia siamensis TaxID=110479 RepID=A0ABQ1MBG6_9PROT|nr:hypothetical protein [Asaia siamensis]GBR07744.1 hypothetical protein AA0323_1906 [Asaia siamensis NRIC 0323]GGC36244.1 hypothetical protein GCM10007207_22220 [Asaia siamensis]
MLKNSIFILAALCVWAISSALGIVSPYGTPVLSDFLDMLGEGLFIGGLLFMFTRMAVGMVKSQSSRRSLH